MPRISDTTAMMEVTATTLPRTIMKERSLFVQTDDSATEIASRNLFMNAASWPPRRGRGPHLDGVAIAQVADGIERPDDDLVALLQARQHFEVLVTRDPRLDRHELDRRVARDEHAFLFLPGLSLRQFVGRRAADAGASGPLLLLLADDLPLLVVRDLTYRERLDRH